MTEPVLDEVELVVDALKRVSPEEQEAAILELEERNPGIGERVRALLALERQAFEAIRKAEADGRRIVAEAKARAERKPDVEPKAKPELRIVEPAEKKPVEWKLVQRADGTKWMVRGNDWRRHFGPMPQLKVVEQAKPEPEPEAEEDRKAEPEEPDVEDRIAKPIRLDLEAPYDVARLFVRFNEDKRGVRRYAFVGKIEGKSIRRPTLYHWRSDFKCWNGRCYDDVDDEQIRAQVYDFLDQAVYPNNVRIKPKPKHVNEVIDGLRAGTNLVGDAPRWIEAVERPEPQGLLICKNGLLELDTGKLWDHDPRLFCLNSVDFEFDPGARAPRWQQFLGEVWPRNEEAVATLQEFFGLWLTDETKYQKALGLIGPPRSGKGTIGRVLKGLLGSTGYVAISLQTLGEDFGLANLIGKKLALVPDVKLDRRANITRIMERLLSTIGEDDQTINRKNDKYWHGRLTIRWLILGNDIPKFRGTDEAGAFVARMIMVPLYESFYGRGRFRLDREVAWRAGRYP